MLYWQGLLACEVLPLGHFQTIPYRRDSVSPYLHSPFQRGSLQFSLAPDWVLERGTDLSLRPAPLQRKGILLTSCRWNLSQTVSCFWPGVMPVLSPLSCSCVAYHNTSRYIDRRAMESMEVVTTILAIALSRSHISNTRIDLSGKRPYQTITSKLFVYLCALHRPLTERSVRLSGI